MKKISGISRLFRIVLCLCCLGMALSVPMQGEAAKKTIAVMPFENVSGYDEAQVAEGMAERFVDALIRCGSYRVVERAQLSYAMREMGLGMTGAVTSESAVQVGRLLGADYSLVGKVVSASVEVNGMAVSVIDALHEEMNGSYADLIANIFLKPFRGNITVEYRIFDNATGTIIAAHTVEGHETARSVRVALDKAAIEAKERALKQLQELNPFAAIVADVDGKTIYIDKGSSEGIRKGEKLRLINEGAPVVVNGKIIAVKEKPVGEAVVKEVGDGYAICRITDNSGLVRKGTLAKRK